MLGVGRAFGDIEYKKPLQEASWNRTFKGDVLSSTPDVRIRKLTPQDKFIILACDGVWDVMSSKAVVSNVFAQLGSGETNLQKVCEGVLQEALSSTH